MHRIQIRDVLEHRVTERAAEVVARERQRRAAALHDAAIDLRPQPSRLAQRRGPRVDAHIKRAREGHFGEMRVAAAQVDHGAGEFDVLVKPGLDGPQQPTEGRQVEEVAGQEIGSGHRKGVRRQQALPLRQQALPLWAPQASTSPPCVSPFAPRSSPF